ncbi:hypothetical protein [Nocardioides aurantiacus]|uniref:Uncharacterized protein n=1 Tax=Nocardioides aurantiacus TaxID=86796 RepID=A0A3N2CTW3_9ACTN|nr:hypothetical protein [Nocardioides aurantiacus]ROR90951.1 hypothetical protein EDD33_1808 [Nocardioides aurantiacus]
MPILRPAADATPADWLLDAARAGDGPTVLRYGPPGFDTYLRLPIDPVGPIGLGPAANVNAMATALHVLTGHTNTPDNAYVAMWEGYNLGPEPDAPRVPLPNALMFLYAGPVSAMRYAAQTIWADAIGKPDTSHDVEPDLVWPADHAWCLACEVDEEIEFSIGCSNTAAEALEAALPDLVRRVAYGEDAPWERNRR